MVTLVNCENENYYHYENYYHLYLRMVTISITRIVIIIDGGKSYGMQGAKCKAQTCTPTLYPPLLVLYFYHMLLLGGMGVSVTIGVGICIC